MSPEQMNERILVCVNYGQHGERLIKRGAGIAQQLQCPLFILVFDALPEEDYKNDKFVDMSFFRELADDYRAELIIEKGHAHDITKVIKKTAIYVRATQIMIGQRVENIWTNLLGGSVIDILLHDVPDADIHVIPKSRAEEPELDLERGVQACLVQQADGTYLLHFELNEDAKYEGIFFKHIGTDFNNGIFAFHYENRIYEVHVKGGSVANLTDINDE